MILSVVPTKGNLLATQKSLELAEVGFDLMDRKRNILIRELVSLVATSKELRHTIESTYAEAYQALQQANITLGLVEHLATGIDIDHGVRITYRSVMGVEIPKVSLVIEERKMSYGFTDTNSSFDRAFLRFQRAKEITVVLAETENSICRLTNEIKKTQRRANALQNIIIPQLTERIKWIKEALDEKEREEFSRLKVLKKRKW